MAADRSNRAAAAASALENALEPIVNLLLELGHTSSWAEGVMRDVFVATAHKKLGAEMKRVPISLVALRCGLYRRDVRKRLDRKRKPLSAEPSARHRLNQLITGWHEDPEFLTKHGKPRTLAVSGPRSFETLVSRYTAYMYPAVVRSELKRAGVLQDTPAGSVKIVQREYAGRDLDDRRLAEMGQNAKDILSTLAANVERVHGGPLLLKAMGFNIDPRYSALINAIVRSRSEIFMKLLEEELGDPSRRAASGDGVRMGVTLVGFQADDVAPASHDEKVNRPRRPPTRLARSG